MRVRFCVPSRVARLCSVHSKKIIVRLTSCLGTFGTKTLGKFSKPVCVFRKIGHSIKTYRITFTVKYFGPGVTKIDCLKYKRNMEIMQNMACLFYKLQFS